MSGKRHDGAAGRAAARLIPGAHLLDCSGAPHRLFCTERGQWDADLPAFIKG